MSSNSIGIWSIIGVLTCLFGLSSSCSIPQSKVKWTTDTAWYNNTLNLQQNQEKNNWQKHWAEELNATDSYDSAKVSIETVNTPIDLILAVLAKDLDINLILRSAPHIFQAQLSRKMHLHNVDLSHLLVNVMPAQMGYYYNEVSRILRVGLVEELAVYAQKANQFSTLYLKFLAPSALKKILDELYQNAPSKPTIVASDSQKMLLMSGDIEQQNNVNALRTQLDKPRQLYFVEAWVLETNIAQLSQLGLSTGYNDAEGSFMSPGSSANPFIEFTNERFNLQMNGFQNNGKGEIISNPKFYVLEGEPVHLFQGQEIPYIVTSSTSNQNSQNTQFREAGLKLALTVSRHGAQTLNIKLQLNKDTVDTSKDNPPISKREIATEMYMQPRVHSLIGGIAINSDSSSSQQLPVLNKIPIIGKLLSSKDSNADSTQLYLILYIDLLGPDF